MKYLSRSTPVLVFTKTKPNARKQYFGTFFNIRGYPYGHQQITEKKLLIFDSPSMGTSLLIFGVKTQPGIEHSAQTLVYKISTHFSVLFQFIYYATFFIIVSCKKRLHSPGRKG